MQVSEPNDVKIYNLSAGKSLPEVIFLYIIMRYLIIPVRIYIKFYFSGCQNVNEEHYLRKMQILKGELNLFKILICQVLVLTLEYPEMEIIF